MQRRSPRAKQANLTGTPPGDATTPDTIDLALRGIPSLPCQIGAHRTDRTNRESRLSHSASSAQDAYLGPLPDRAFRLPQAIGNAISAVSRLSLSRMRRIACPSTVLPDENQGKAMLLTT